MNRIFKIVLITLVLIAIIAASYIFISNANIAVLNPKGMIAMKQRDLIYTASWLMLLVVIPVFIFALFFAWKYRADRKAKYTPDWAHSHLAECFWWGVPFVIVVILAVITWRSSHELDPYKPIDLNKKSLTIQVVALDWKWLFLYPEQGIATVNFVEFPEQTPIAFEITADAPMNSFWIPQLGGQIYAMPAMKTKLHLIANEQGTFRGSSANYSGEGFAGMTFIAKATSQEEFEAWVESVKQSGDVLDLEEYTQLARPSEYNQVKFYVLKQDDLFDRIIMNYMMPKQE